VTNKKNKHYIFAPTAGARSAIFTKLCMVIEIVVHIKKGVIHFSIQKRFSRNFSRIKSPKNFRNRSRELPKGVAPAGRLFTKKWKFLIFSGRIPTPLAIEVKFCTAKRTHVSVGPAKFDVNQYNKSPLRGEKPDFSPVSKFNIGSLPLCGILPVKNKHHTFAPTAGGHYAIFPKLCM